MDLYDYASEMTVKAPAGMILFHIGECPRVLVLNPEGQRILGMDAARAQPVSGQLHGRIVPLPSAGFAR